MEWFLAITEGVCAVTLLAILFATLASARGVKAQSAALLKAMQAAGEAESRARESADKQLNEGIRLVASGIDAIGQGVRDVKAQIETLDKQHAADAKAASGAVVEQTSKSANHLQALVAKFESLGAVAKEVQSALDREGNKRIESHTWLATELKNVINGLNEQIGRSHSSLSAELKERIIELTQQVGRLQTSLEASLQF